MKGAIALRRPTQTANGTQTILTSAWTTILAKALNLYATSGIEIFNASGSILQLATGDAGSEVALPYTILPGGSQSWISVEIPRNVRISAKAIDAATDTAQLILNMFG